MTKLITLFTEDSGHEAFVSALLKRTIRDLRLKSAQFKISRRSVRGGYGKVTSELKEYVRDIRIFKEPLPDLMIVATDSNCVGYAARCRSLQDCIGSDFNCPTAFVVPDPHVERWMLLDPLAFKRTFGTACQLPAQKCDKDWYKHLLGEAFHATDYAPILNGFEWTGDIVNAMDFGHIQDDSFKRAVQQITSNITLLKSTGTD